MIEKMSPRWGVREPGVKEIGRVPFGLLGIGNITINFVVSEN